MLLYGYNSIPFDTTKAVKPTDPFCIRNVSWMWVVPSNRTIYDFEKLDIYCAVLNSLDNSEPYTLIKTGGNTNVISLNGNGWTISQNLKDRYATYGVADTFTLWNGFGTFPRADSTNSYYQDYHKNNT